MPVSAQREAPVRGFFDAADAEALDGADGCLLYHVHAQQTRERGARAARYRWRRLCQHFPAHIRADGRRANVYHY